jgi:hypothetical protein
VAANTPDEELKRRFAESYPEEKEGWRFVEAAMVRRFAREVPLPSCRDPQVQFAPDRRRHDSGIGQPTLVIAASVQPTWSERFARWFFGELASLWRARA